MEVTLYLNEVKFSCPVCNLFPIVPTVYDSGLVPFCFDK